MLESYILKYKNIEIGVLSYNTETDIFNFTISESLDNSNLLPPIMYPFLNRDMNYLPPSQAIKAFIKNRTLPEERDGIEVLLKPLGMTHYNLWAICKSTRAMSLDDYYWLSKSGEKFEECHVRYFAEQNQPEKITTVLSKFNKEVVKDR